MGNNIKTIWLVNKYAMPPQYESRLRTIKFAHYLQEMGYKVTIFGSSVMHNMELDLIEDDSKYIVRDYGDLHFVHIKSCMYKKTAGVSRIWSEIQFHYRLVTLAKKFEQPDLVVATTFPLFSNPILKYCHKHKIRYITEVLDWWPDDFVDFGLISAQNPRVNQYTIDDADLKSDKKRIIYLGAIRLANNVGQFIKAAELLKNRTDVEFMIYGNGDDREPLIQYCQEHRLTNIKFKEKWIDPEYVPYVLSQSYLNILNYTKGFGKYGISSSKMFQYMAAGRPIVCNVDIMYSPIVKHKIGVCHDMENDQAYAESILSILDLSEKDYFEIHSQNTYRSAYAYMIYFYCLKRHEQGKEMDFFGM